MPVHEVPAPVQPTCRSQPDLSGPSSVADPPACCAVGVKAHLQLHTQVQTHGLRWSCTSFGGMA
eukprot:CAMPEP_0195106402 /NCGR_PEP_ID=MMETSP0448-20130528/80552_1 /TAXON_ID=66468 /ORGANISM="Heterocapsa triquestra, Strain CCMP 448" /LENGTH=63 /DNA_ID=CAMNT_0040142651 /DNA_START=52 /DNA_END=240 /DNA_ORIENTATION=+